MKLKSFIAGVVGVLLLLSGQNLVAQQGGPLPPPDQTASKIPPPDPANALPPPAGSTSSEDRGAQGFTGGIFSLPPASGQGVPAETAAGHQTTAGQEPTAEQAAEPAATTRRSLPRTGVALGLLGGVNFSDYNTDDTEWVRRGGELAGRVGGNWGLSLGFDFGALIFETEALFAFDHGKARFPSYYNYDKHDVIGFALRFPLLFKLDLHLGPLVLQPFAGPYFNLAVGKMRLYLNDYNDNDNNAKEQPYANPPFGFTFGGLVGIALGRGILFVDGRYEIDMGRIVVSNNSLTMGRRSAFVMNAGFQLYLGRNR